MALPWGLRLEDTSQEGTETIAQAGCDFVVFSANNTSLEILQNDEIGKVLQVEASFSEGLLRSIEVLPVDAVFMTAPGGSADQTPAGGRALGG